MTRDQQIQFMETSKERHAARTERWRREGVLRGLFASLTEEQRQRVLAYDGPENHGESAFARR
ncbi:hypothetical protein SMB554_07125 [Sinorhizobium meliloti]|nr:hypothetical protein SMB554_07125 [Sinorhizobium meliloti]